MNEEIYKKIKDIENDKKLNKEEKEKQIIVELEKEAEELRKQPMDKKIYPAQA